jgi:two-component system OmpR family sensor kinase
MSRSLERQLSRTLGLTIILVGMAAGAVSFMLAFQEAEEFQDDTLRQIATVSDVDELNAGGRHDAVISTLNSTEGDPEDRVLVVSLSAGAMASPLWLSTDLQPGFPTVRGPGGNWRVFVRETLPGKRLAVAQATDMRDEAAMDSALRTLVPLAILLPLLVWLIARIVRKEFAPLRLLAQKLDEQPPEHPKLLPDAGLLDEIAPFVRAINRLLERVTRLMGEQRRFVADAAHELRTPLTALSLQAQNLDKAATLELVRERIVPLRAGIERARRLTEQLLSLARSQAGAPVLESVNVSKVARELIAEYLALAEERDIDLGLDAAEDIVLTAEPRALSSILKNGLDNALRYTPSGGEVTLSLYTEGDAAVIEVRDSGPGIAVAERQRVFDPFYRLDGSHGEGSGLGLAIARDAAARLGGTVSLHDRSDGPGLVFRYRQNRVP